MSTGTASPSRVPGAKRPLARGDDGLLIETEGRIERAHDLHVADTAVRADHALEQDRALHFGTHRIRGVLRALFVQHARKRDAVAGPVHTAAGTTATAGSEARTCARADAAPRAGAGPTTASDPCDKVGGPGGASIAPGSESCAAARLFAGMFSCATGSGSFLTSCISIFGGFETGTVILSLPGISADAAVPSSGCRRHRHHRPARADSAR